MSEPSIKQTSFLSQLALVVATGAGFGFSPKAPGTVGAIWGIPLSWLIMQVDGVPSQLAIIAALYLVGIPICTSAARSIGRKDPGAVVWDEIATVPIVFLFVDASLISRPEILLLGFGLHRLFDISKLPPIKRLERLPDGLGIMSDDVLAAGYACMAVLFFSARYITRPDEAEHGA